jgi:hypothetical protein
MRWRNSDLQNIHPTGRIKNLPRCRDLTLVRQFEEAQMFTAFLVTAIVLPAMFLAHMVHEELLSQRAYRKARVRSPLRTAGNQ